MKEQTSVVLKESKQEEQKSKKKISLIKKKMKTQVWTHLYKNVDINHVVNINDLIFINQNALKNPQNSESMMSAIFFYKMISKVAINQNYVSIILKKLDQNALPPQYYIQRLKSYGDAKYNNIANYLQKLRKQFSHLNETQITKQTKELESYRAEHFVVENDLQMLAQQLKIRKGKMYLIFFSQICPCGVMLKKIVISTALLKQLGYNINEIGLDFLKHKHIFFQIFTAKMYSTMIEAILRRYSTVTEAIMNKQSSYSDLQEQESIIYQDEMIRRKQTNGNYQEDLLSVRVKLSSPHPAVVIYDIDEVKQLSKPYNSGYKQIKKLELPNIQEQLKSLQHLTKIDPSLLQQNKNRCCSFKVISHSSKLT